MNKKVLVELYVPKIEKKYNVYLPVSKTLGEIIVNLEKMLNELTGGYYSLNSCSGLYNRQTGNKYDLNQTVKEAMIYNAFELILI